MKAITIRQPYASLILAGLKTFETRSWAPPKALIGQRIAIHAGAAKPSADVADDAAEFVGRNYPLGRVIATAELTAAYQLAATRDFVDDPEWAGEATVNPATCLGPPLDTFRVGWGDCHFGRWDIGGWAWKLTNVLPVEPFAAKGQLGLWMVNLP